MSCSSDQAAAAEARVHLNKLLDGSGRSAGRGGGLYIPQAGVADPCCSLLCRIKQTGAAAQGEMPRDAPEQAHLLANGSRAPFLQFNRLQLIHQASAGHTVLACLLLSHPLGFNQAT